MLLSSAVVTDLSVIAVVVGLASDICTVSDVEADVGEIMSPVVKRLRGGNVETARVGITPFVMRTGVIVSSVVTGDRSDVICSDDVWLVIVMGVVVCVSGRAVMTMSGGQFGLPPKKVASARYTQSELGERANRRIISEANDLGIKHILTNEEHEIVLTLIIVICVSLSNA